MGIRTDLTPWLVSVFVEKEYRNQGVGTMLIFHVLNVDESPVLHLWTFNERLAKYYNKFGFETIDHQEGFIVMQRLNPRSTEDV
jgi:GNAT superfamily N-acetyltransferase